MSYGVFTEALREYLDDIKDEDAFKEDVIELYLQDEIGFETLQEFIERQNAEAVHSSKTLHDEGEELVDELAETDDRRRHK